MALTRSVSYLFSHRFGYTECLGSRERTEIFSTSSSPPCYSLGLDSFSLQFGPVSYKSRCRQPLLIMYVYADVGGKGSSIFMSFSVAFYFICLRQGLSLNVKLLIQLHWLASDSLGCSCLYLTSAGILVLYHHTYILYGCWKSKLKSSFYLTLPTEECIWAISNTSWRLCVWPLWKVCFPFFLMETLLHLTLDLEFFCFQSPLFCQVK